MLRPHNSTSSLPHRPSLHSKLIRDVASIEPFRSAWDALAVALRRPFCAPAWVLSWWKEAAPKASLMLLVAVFVGDELVGVAPFFAQLGFAGCISCKLFAAETAARIEPLARPGTEREVASEVARQLATADPRPHFIAFEGVPTSSHWPELLREEWPGSKSPWLSREMSMTAPTLQLRGTSYEKWFATKNSHWRGEIRRRRRRLDESGAVFKLASTAEELQSGLAEFAALHYSRWRWRGGSGALTPAVEVMLLGAATQLLDSGRFRLWSIEVDGKAISSQIFVGAGGELSYWLGGFDESWAKLGPSIQAVLAALRHAWESGDERMDFGAGGQEYKLDLASGADSLEWTTLVPRGLRYPITRAQLLPRRLRHYALHTLSERLTPNAKNRMKRVLRKARSLGGRRS
jgi:CelD/BcsL family acetyltransferase involved in cellulose biosynthesis